MCPTRTCGCSMPPSAVPRSSPVRRRRTSGRPGLPTAGGWRSRRSGHGYDIYVKALDVREDEKVLWHSEADKLVEDWSPDGRTLSVTVLRSGLWSYPVDPRRSRRSSAGGDAETCQSEFSPDGRWLAYVSSASGQAGGVRRAGARDRGRVPGVDQRRGGAALAADGRELFYLTLDHWLAAIAVPPSGAWGRTAPTRLFKVPIPETLGGSDFSVSPSGEFAVNTLQANQTIPPVEVVVNWTALLER